jgi:Ca2+-binding RTX toxin-like protein
VTTSKKLSNDDNWYVGGRDVDYISALDGDDHVEGREGDDHLNGDPGDDDLYGGIGNDKLYGGAGEDYLDGGDGDDLLVGGINDDVYVGGKGKDVFTSVSLALNIPGFDRIEDFTSGEDKIRIASQVDWSEDLDTNGNGVLDNGDAYVSYSGKTSVIDMADAAGFFDKLDVLIVKSAGPLAEIDFIY